MLPLTTRRPATPAEAESSTHGLTVETIVDERALAPHRGAWAELAVAAGRPYSLPGWMLAWWKHARPPEAQLRVIAVRDGERLVGIAPFYVDGGTYRLLASPVSEPVEPLAAPGREAQVAACLAAELESAEPHAEAIDLGMQWATAAWGPLLCEAWPSSKPPLDRVGARIPVNAIRAEGHDFDAWLQTLSAKTRANIRRGRRRLAETGARFRLADPDSIERDVGEMLRLHSRRHAGKGSPLAREEVPRMLVAAGRELIPAGQFRLVCLEADDHFIAAALMLAAGGEVTGWSSGFDEAYAKFSPSLNVIVEGVAVAIEHGDRAFDLGPDTAPYKQRIADEERELVSRILIPRGRGHIRKRQSLALRSARGALQRLSGL